MRLASQIKCLGRGSRALVRKWSSLDCSARRESGTRRDGKASDHTRMDPTLPKTVALLLCLTVSFNPSQKLIRCVLTFCARSDIVTPTHRTTRFSNFTLLYDIKSLLIFSPLASVSASMHNNAVTCKYDQGVTSDRVRIDRGQGTDILLIISAHKAEDLATSHS